MIRPIAPRPGRPAAKRTGPWSPDDDSREPVTDHDLNLSDPPGAIVVYLS